MIKDFNNNKYVIIYNGELYNTKELRDDLISKGYTFSTSCDTEVVLNSYIHYGDDCVNLLNGIFAFAISQNGEAGSVGLVIMLAAFLLGLVFCVLAALAMPAVYILASENKSWLAVTNFSRLKEIMTSSISTYIITTLVGMVYNFVASCVAGPFSVLTSPMACICNGQLLGQYARNMDLRSFA